MLTGKAGRVRYFFYLGGEECRARPTWSGLIDPTEMTRIALQNAASIGSLMLMTEAMVAAIPEKKLARPGGYGLEGMDY